MFEEASFGKQLERMRESFLLAAAAGGNAEDCQSLLGLGACVNWRHQSGAPLPSRVCVCVTHAWQGTRRCWPRAGGSTRR